MALLLQTLTVPAVGRYWAYVLVFVGRPCHQDTVHSIQILIAIAILIHLWLAGVKQNQKFSIISIIGIIDDRIKQIRY